MFLLIKEDEKGEWKNYYKVDDYYTPKENSKEDCWLGLCYEKEALRNDNRRINR